jgi:hypothetical protein
MHFKKGENKIMKRAVFVLLAIFGLASIASAQDHVEVGAFADYFRLHETGTNFAGLGGRVGVTVAPHVQMEAEMSYDFNQAFTEGFTTTSGSSVTTFNSSVKVLNGMIGPKIQTSGPVKLFLTVKGGGTDFQFSPAPATFSTFTSSVTNLRANNVDAVLYPGGGIEGFIGPLGLRVDVGDEIIFVSGGAQHNWKVTFGPTFRF